MDRRTFNLSLLALAGCGGDVEYPLTGTPRQRISKNLFETGVQGLWTPAISSATPGDLSVVYGTRVGSFIRIGNILISQYSIGFTPTFTTATGTFLITGGTYFDKIINTESFTGPVGTSKIILSANYSFFTCVPVTVSKALTLLEHGSNQSYQNVQIQTGCTSGVAHIVQGSIICRISGVS